MVTRAGPHRGYRECWGSHRTQTSGFSRAFCRSGTFVTTGGSGNGGRVAEEWRERHRGLGWRECRRLRFGSRMGQITQLSGAGFCVSLLEYQATFQGSDQPRSRDCVPGHKVLNSGGSGVRSLLPPSLPSQRHHLGVHQAGTQGVKSARNLQDWSRGGGGGGARRGGVEEKGETDCRETAPGTPSPGTWPLGPQPQKRPCPPRGRALFPRPASALQLCVPRRVGCRISSQALAACSVFPNPPVGEGGSPVRIRVPPPLPLPAPSPRLLFPAPAPFPNFFPFPPWPLRPLSPPLLAPKFQVQVRGARWVPQSRRGAGKAKLCRPTLRPAGRPPDSQPGARPIPRRGPRSTGEGGPGVSLPGVEVVLGEPAELGSGLWCGWCQTLGHASRRGQSVPSAGTVLSSRSII